MPTEARSLPYLASTTEPASPPSGASTPNASACSSSSDHLDFSGDQPRSTDSAAQSSRSSGPSRRIGGNRTPLRSVSTIPDRMTSSRRVATRFAVCLPASRTDEQPPFGDAPAGRHHQVDRRGQRRERRDEHRYVRQHLAQQAQRAA